MAELRHTTTNGPSITRLLLPDMVLIPAGSFLMGDDQGRRDERPAHWVTLDAFLMATLPVSNRAYTPFLESTGHAPPRFWDDADFNYPDQPVVGVSWYEATDYCEWLSAATGTHFRLPTEAERERAMRGGSECDAFPWGNELEPDWLRKRRAAGMGIHSADIVGMSPPNGFGLIDMGYNIHEWCSDWYDPTYYSRSPVHNPTGPADGKRRASRGGAWRHSIRVCRNAARSAIPPEFQYNDYGFRVVAGL